MSICCHKCDYYNECNPESTEIKRGAKIKYHDPIHGAWRIYSRNRYLKSKTKATEVKK